ncbi:MAG TPA: hypothetical protein VFV02_13520 [Acidimicrobiales bacterium]|nr:hypothetical protein [Acidimicrobiales bacterium]
MALAGRSARRGSGARWLFVGIVITLVILLVDASLHSRSPGPGHQLAAGSWVDRVLPVITTSNTEGVQLDQLWSNGLSMKPGQVTALVDQIAAGASTSYKQVVDLRPPSNLVGSAGLLEACLLARSQAASILQMVVNQTLNGPAPSPQFTSQVQTAGNDLQVADQAYNLFASTIPKVGVTMPASQWLGNSNPYQPQAAQVFLASLHSSASTSPLHQLSIYAVTTTPAPVNAQGPTQVLPDARAITVTIVVADTGNQPERNLTVTASIAPSAGAASAKDFVDLLPGQAHTIENVGPLNPPQGAPVTLTVTLTPPAGSATPVQTKTILFSMPAPPPSTTTTSTTAPPKKSGA